MKVVCFEQKLLFHRYKYFSTVAPSQAISTWKFWLKSPCVDCVWSKYAEVMGKTWLCPGYYVSAGEDNITGFILWCSSLKSLPGSRLAFSQSAKRRSEAWTVSIKIMSGGMPSNTQFAPRTEYTASPELASEGPPVPQCHLHLITMEYKLTLTNALW